MKHWLNLENGSVIDKTTPATSVTVLDDLPDSNQKTVWFNSRFYRANLLWDNGTLRFRDIHIFDENMASSYLKEKGTSNQCIYYTPPFVDGYRWSSSEIKAGLWFYTEKNGQDILLKGEELSVSEPEDGTLMVVWKLNDELGSFVISMDEESMEIDFEGDADTNWSLTLNAAEDIDLPFSSVEAQNVKLEFENIRYEVFADKGRFVAAENNNVFKLLPDADKIKLDFAIDEPK